MKRWPRRDWRFLGLTAGASGLIAGAAVITPLGLLIVPGALAVAALRYPVGRLLWVVFGGLLVLQSSQGISVPKLLYIAGVLVSVGCAWERLRDHRDEPWLAPFHRALQGSACLALLVAGWAVVGLAHGATAADVARDGLAYGLIAVGPLLAVDAVVAVGTVAVNRLLAVSSLVATVAFAVAWISRRGAGSVDVNQVLLASTVLMAVGVSLGVVRGTAGERLDWRWLLLPPVVILGQLITGTRTGLVLIIGLLGAIGTTSRRRFPLARLVAVVASFAGIAALLLPFLSQRLLKPGFLQQRLESAVQAVTGGFSSDQSGSERLAAQTIALRNWEAHPFVGVGLGVPYRSPLNPTATTHSLDTSLVYLAKFGLVGSALLALSLVLMFQAAAVARRAAGRPFPEYTLVRGWAVTMLALLPFFAPTEDKGFGLAVPLLLLAAGVGLRQAVVEQENGAATPVAVGSSPSRPPAITARRPGVGHGRTGQSGPQTRPDRLGSGRSGA